jgi:hypothetical protein
MEQVLEAYEAWALQLNEPLERRRADAPLDAEPELVSDNDESSDHVTAGLDDEEDVAEIVTAEGGGGATLSQETVTLLVTHLLEPPDKDSLRHLRRLAGQTQKKEELRQFWSRVPESKKTVLSCSAFAKRVLEAVRPPSFEERVALNSCRASLENALRQARAALASPGTRRFSQAKVSIGTIAPRSENPFLLRVHDEITLAEMIESALNEAKGLQHFIKGGETSQENNRDFKRLVLELWIAMDDHLSIEPTVKNVVNLVKAVAPEEWATQVERTQAKSEKALLADKPPNPGKTIKDTMRKWLPNALAEYRAGRYGVEFESAEGQGAREDNQDGIPAVRRVSTPSTAPKLDGLDAVIGKLGKRSP